MGDVTRIANPKYLRCVTLENIENYFRRKEGILKRDIGD